MTVSALLAEALSRLDVGDWASAGRAAMRILDIAPGDPAPYYIVGVAASRMQAHAVAVDYLQRAVEIDDRQATYWGELARAFVEGGRMSEAIGAADRAAGCKDVTAHLLDMLGVIYGRTNEHAKARLAFIRAVAIEPENGTFRLNLATAHMFAGELGDAEREFEASLECDPSQWRAHLFLAQLRRNTPESNHIARLKVLASTVAEPNARLYVNMALAKELEDVGSYREAFQHMVLGKRAGAEGRGYQFARDLRLFESLLAATPAQAMAGSENDEPIFIIGMPRSGTTLVDRILSSHPDVTSAGELRNFVVTLHRHAGGGSDFLLDGHLADRVRGLDWARIGDEYVASTRPVTGRTRHFIDKLPHNFLFAGFIARALPNARIVCLRRDPVDTCLSNFRQVFAVDSPYFDYSYDILDTGRYYGGFDRVMTHWREALPGRILELSYEELVADQEGQTRRLLQFCGLPWDQACMRFEGNAAPVATASAVQVRSRMNRDSIGRWKRYGDDLAPLLDVLQRGGSLG